MQTEGEGNDWQTSTCNGPIVVPQRVLKWCARACVSSVGANPPETRRERTVLGGLRRRERAARA